MKKILIIALAAFFGAFASNTFAQSHAPRYGTSIVLGGNGGIDLTNTLTFKSSLLGAPKTYTFPVPSSGLFHSDASGGLTLGAVALGSNGLGGDVSGILLPANGGSGVNNGTNTLTITGGNVTITGPATISGTSSGNNTGDVTLVQNGGETYLTLAAQVLTANLINLASSTNVTGILPPLNGGTGIANVNTSTITLGGPISTSNNFTTTGGNVTIVGPFNGTPASTGNTVAYNSASIQNTATTAGGDFLFNVAYGTTNTAAAAGAVINSTTTNAASNATGLAITSVATATATSTGLTVSSTGGANNYAATFTNGSVGIGTAAPNVSLDIVKDVATREFADATAWGASTDNVAIDGGTNQFGMARLGGAPAANFTFTSIAGPSNGKRVTIYNASGKTMTLANQSVAGGATPANKIITSTGADLTIATGGSATLAYSAGDSRWIVQGTSNGNSGGGGGGTPGGANTQIQFNNSGAFGGSANFVWDNTNARVGIGLTSPNTSLDIVKDISTREFANSTAFVATQDNVLFDGGTNQFMYVRLGGAPAVNFTFTSIGGPTNGKQMTIYNASGKTMTLANQSAAAGATPGFKIITGTGADVTIASGGTANLVYSAAEAAGIGRWILHSSSNGNVSTGLTGFAAPSANTVNISAPTAGVATTAMRSDATLQLDQSIAPTWSGAHIFSNTVNINNTATLAKTFATTEVTNSTVFVATQNDVVFDGGTNQASWVRLGGAPLVGFTFTSIANPASGKRLTLYNATGQIMTLANNSGSGTAINRITTGTGADLAIPTGGTADLIYSAAETRWIVKSSSNGNASTPTLFARRSTQLDYASNNTVADDAQLTVAVVSSATYEFSGVIAYSGNNAASDLQLAFNTPAGSTIRWSVSQAGTALSPSSVTGAGGATTAISPFKVDGTTPANAQTIFYSGVLITAGSAGSLSVREAQVTAANTTSILINSTLKATRVQ